MSRALVLGVGLLAACTELPAFEAGVCGNFVLDPGEDCDVASDDCAQCRLQCPAGVAAGEPCSVDGYVCGLDGVCQAPSGRFGARAAAVPLAGSSLAVTDIDRDGYGDVIALSATSLTVSFGEASGAIGRQLSTLTPVVRGAPGFARLDDDDSLDVVLPTDDGVLAYSSPYGMLAPHPFPMELQISSSCSDMLGTPFHVFRASDRYVGVAYTDAQNDIGIAIIDAQGRQVCPTANFPDVCPNAPGANAREVDVYPLAPVGVRQGRVVAATTSEGLCAVLLNGPASAEVGVFTVEPLTAPKAVGSPRYPAIAGRPVLADLEQNDGCPSVVFSTGAGASLAHHEYLGQSELGSCTLATTPVSLPEDVLRVPSQVIGHFELAPASSYFGKDALVFASGASAVSLGANRELFRLYRSDRALTDVRAGDFDDDGDVDVAAISAGNEDIDVLYRLPQAPGAAFPSELLRFRIDTLGPVGRFEVGDFDGNQADDIVFAEQAVSSQRLMMAYGTRDRLLEPTTHGMYQNVIALCQIQAPASADPFDAVDDLLVLDVPGTGTAGGPLMLDASSMFTVLHGSPQRTMLSYFDPRPAGWMVHNTSTIGAVGVGSFSSGVDPVADLLALQVHKPYQGDYPLDNLVEPSATLYRLKNTGAGSFVVAAPIDTGQPGDVGECSPALEYRSCTNRARYLRWPVGDHDVAIAVDARDTDRSAVFDPTSAASVIQFSAAPDGVTAHHDVRALHRIDSNGDGAFELLASFGGDPARGVDPLVALCEVGPDGVPRSPCADLATLVGRARCADAVPARIAPRGRLDPPPGSGTELVAVCDGQVLRVFHDGASYQAVAATPPIPELGFGMAQGLLERAHVGDVTGDGLDDLLVSVSETTSTTPLLLVFPQCGASDVACRGDGAGGTGAAP